MGGPNTAETHRSARVGSATCWSARERATVAAIAGALFLSPGIVCNYLSSAIQKLDAATRGEAMRIAEERGWL